jgi:DNA helicase-2/ATP-dependent DNA helicase PcrA
MDEGSLPHARSVDKPEQLEEERRLAYVGFTRAMYRLYLVRPRHRSFYGESQYTEPSRFLEDIPLDLVSSNSTSSRTKRRNNWNDRDYNEYNQDTSSARDTGRTFGSGKANTYGIGQSNPGSSTPPKWTPRTGSYSSPTVPPSSPSAKKATPGSSQKTPSDQQPAPTAPKGQQFKPGDKVIHSLFGKGTILKSEMEQNTEFVEVQFEGKIGKKRLSMDFAKLEKL